MSEDPEPETLVIQDETLKRGFIQIPKRILLASNLSRDARLLYGVLLHYAWQEDHCFPGIARLCHDMSCGETKLREYMNELKAVRLLEVKRRGLGKTNLYCLCQIEAADLKLEPFTPDPRTSKAMDSHAVKAMDPQSNKDPDPQAGKGKIEPEVIDSALPKNRPAGEKRERLGKLLEYKERAKTDLPPPSVAWPKALDVLSRTLTPLVYRQLEGTEGGKWEGKTLVVRCGDYSQADHLTKRLAGHVKRALSEVVGGPVGVRFVM